MHPGIAPVITAGGRGPSALIDRTTGTNIGDMTGNAGLAAAFDGILNQLNAACASKGSVAGGTGTAYCGKTFAQPTALDFVDCFGASDDGYVNNVDTQVILTLFGKQGAAPANVNDGTQLAQITFTETPPETGARRLTTTDKLTYWNHAWVRLMWNPSGSSRGTYMCEIQMTGWLG